MCFNPKIHHRRSIRLQGYDYSQPGLYYITICTQNKACFFGKINNGKMVLNGAGTMIKTIWSEIPVHYHGFDIHEFVVMPNHVHGIIQIISNPAPVGTGPRACPDNDGHPIKGHPQGVAPTMTLFDIMQRFKSFTTNQYIEGVKQNNWHPFNKKLWQRNYYEHVIRNEKAYDKICEYIATNPQQWQNDKYYA